jgi:hypothetical protein
MSHANLEIRDTINTYCVHDSVLLFVYAYSYVGIYCWLEIVWWFFVLIVKFNCVPAALYVTFALFPLIDIVYFTVVSQTSPCGHLY